MYRLLSIILLVTSLTAHSELVFNNLTERAISLQPDSNTGLEHIYVIDNSLGVIATYSASSASSTVEWTRYSRMGGAYGENVTYSRVGTECTVALEADDTGYIITENGRSHCFWIVNYSNHAMTLNSATVNNGESDCIMTAIDIEGSAPRITYYTINGVPRELSRDITVSYNTLTWNEDSQSYAQHKTTRTIASVESTIRVESPLCDTDFEISGDRFLKEWGREVSAVTPGYNAIAIDVHTRAETSPHDNDNEIAGDNSQLGGSAPIDITFTATTSDAVAFKEWQTSKSPEFDIIDLRFNQEEVIHTFREYGTTYVRFIAANAAGDCDWTSETYQVSIGESRLECPNAFSPGASEGINDEWRVSYKSIVTFECHIFNQWGIELFSTTNPAQGWNGRHGNKPVPAGVYYYVIKARGADGKDYSLAGDINIINFKQGNNRPTTER